MRRTVPLVTAAMLLSWLYVHERFVRDDFDRAGFVDIHGPLGDVVVVSPHITQTATGGMPRPRARSYWSAS